MQRNKGEFVLLLLLLSVQIAVGVWLKRYIETSHRPSYYNRGHNQNMHVDYNRDILAERDRKGQVARSFGLPTFDPNVHKSYYVHILYKGSVFCAGALISHRMVITSSRCFLNNENEPTREYKARQMSVLPGHKFGRPKRKVSNVRAFYLPTSKHGNGNVHDIALLGLKKKMDRKSRYIKLFEQMPKMGSTVNMSFVDSKTQEITLFKTKVVDFEECKSSFEQSGKIAIPFDKEFFCVRNIKTGGCSTRAGDPLIVDSQLAGVNIYGEHCDELEGHHIVDIYYAIPHTIPFIQKATDLLRALTGTGPFNESITTRRTQLKPETTTVKLITTTRRSG
ncbi:brain-specific serine protease 4-like [Drosophila montana]|uniref:brain-specific serine protease 4-like n=1 Tax=Drosophila montana TaxID=40370 RepID=UPI00313C1F2B